jgi:hypothetical protein
MCVWWWRCCESVSAIRLIKMVLLWRILMVHWSCGEMWSITPFLKAPLRRSRELNKPIWPHARKCLDVVSIHFRWWVGPDGDVHHLCIPFSLEHHKGAWLWAWWRMMWNYIGSRSYLTLLVFNFNTASIISSQNKIIQRINYIIANSLDIDNLQSLQNSKLKNIVNSSKSHWT